jgi:serine/threonine protein kinase
MINKIIKDYSIKNELGQGGMATVYLAEHNLLGNKSAFKLLNKEYVHNENIRKRFLAEARSMARMSHTNIIKVTDLIDDGETVAFIMEYVEGETLKEYIERKVKLTDEEIQSLFSQMLDALGYVHEQNLVHRDIKPSNFMIDPKGKVKLMDFGIAKTTDTASAEYTQTGTGVQMGTPMYMSPEQITETKSVTPQSDIYSLGVVLWQMVTGEKPYDMKTLSTFHLQNKIVNEALPETNTRFDQIIKIATNKEIDTRFQNTSKFKDALVKEEKTIEVPFNDEKTIVESAEKSNKIKEPKTQSSKSTIIDDRKSMDVNTIKNNSLIDKLAIFILIGSVLMYKIYFILRLGNVSFGYLLFDPDSILTISLLISVLGFLFSTYKKWFFYIILGFLFLNEFLAIYRLLKNYSVETDAVVISYTLASFVYIISLILLFLKDKRFAIISFAITIILIFIGDYMIQMMFPETPILNIYLSFMLIVGFYAFNYYSYYKLNLKIYFTINSLLLLILLISIPFSADSSILDLSNLIGVCILFFTLLHFSKKLHAEDSVNK